MKNYPCYININESENYVFATGMEFRNFIRSIPRIPYGILILRGFPTRADFDFHMCLEYVSQSDMQDLIQEDVYNYGDFCWADFKSDGDIQKVTDAELAELLFAAHMKRPLGTPFFKALGNDYLYLCHDDDYWVKVYMKNIQEYKPVIEQKIRSVFMGRKKSMEPIPENIMEELYRFFIGGAVFDFENCVVSSIHTGVNIYPVRNIDFCADNIHRELDHQRNVPGVGIYLEYNPKTKKWKIY